jgi:hypothetical protein
MLSAEVRASVQVFELHRFGADLLLGQAVLPLRNLPRGGRPKYQWVEIEDSRCETLSESGSTTENEVGTAESARNLVHLRLEWSEHHEQSAYTAVHLVLRGVGFSVIDSLSKRIPRELAFVHLMDLQVQSPSSLLTSALHRATSGSKSAFVVQAHYRQDAEEKAGNEAYKVQRKSMLAITLQNFQVDNQLLTASMPVVICRRERMAVGKGGGNQGLLKAAQREFERQRQGAPLLTMQCSRNLSNHQGSITDAVVIKYAAPSLEFC